MQVYLYLLCADGWGKGVNLLFNMTKSKTRATTIQNPLKNYVCHDISHLLYWSIFYAFEMSDSVVGPVIVARDYTVNRGGGQGTEATG